jgi:hypothetical protein
MMVITHLKSIEKRAVGRVIESGMSVLRCA